MKNGNIKTKKATLIKEAETYLNKIEPEKHFTIIYESVYLNNSFLADMYTTSIMNTYSISEAFSVFNSLNSIYHQEDASLILCYKSDKDSNFFYYNDNQLSPLDDNGKVISVLKDGTTYNGDYSDISNPYSITGSKSSRKSKYYETYLVSNNLYKNVHIINDSIVVTRPENVKAIIKEQAEWLNY